MSTTRSPSRPAPATSRHLLLVAHGSRRVASNDEVRRLTQSLAECVDGTFAATGCAFLEFAEPSIPEGIQRCIDAGAGEIVILPYFLSAGRHVTEDIPAIVRDKQVEYPDVKLRIAPWLGAAPGLTGVLAGLANGT